MANRPNASETAFRLVPTGCRPPGRRKRFRLLGASFSLGVTAMFVPSAIRGEHCWLYVDNEFPGRQTLAPAPFTCVRESDLSTPCSWTSGGQACFLDRNTSDCCASVPAPDRRDTILVNHTRWHDCFGNTAPISRGMMDGAILSPPPGRGARWLAFHRQLEFDFDLFREASFGCNPMSRLGDGCFIETLDWRRNMVFPYGHFGANRDDHREGCGTGPNRPNNVTCSACQPFPRCLFMAGAGPIGGGTPEPACPPLPEFASFTLDQIPTLDRVAMVLDHVLHADIHGQVGAPFEGTCTTDNDCLVHPGADSTATRARCRNRRCVYTLDVTDPRCSPRDGMFWRLHKRLDDTVRAWQKGRPIDLSVVVDRSGSMSETDRSGRKKISVATEAIQMVADLIADGQPNRLGVVSYSTDATSDLSLTPSSMVRDAIGPVAADVEARVGGCTSIGSGLEGAVAQLCNGISRRPGSMGKISCNTAEDMHRRSEGTNERKAIILLTDGLENRAPCLRSSGGAKPNCGSVCGGGQFDFGLLGPHTQLCAVGFGQAGSLNGNLLTQVSERQGGIYMQSPAKGPNDRDGQSGQGRFVDLKDFFVKCLGQISDEFVGLDPKGTMPSRQRASDPVNYTGACGDERITFVSGWNEDDRIHIMVNAPNGDLVPIRDSSVEFSHRLKWSFIRLPLPYRGQQAGAWRAQLVRSHQNYINGFTTDSLPNSIAVPLVRRQIQRLCPGGCGSALYFEDGRVGPRSAYEDALSAEQVGGLLRSVTRASSPSDFATKLGANQAWDIVVYAHQMSNQPEPYDSALLSRFCSLQPGIVTDTRTDEATGDKVIFRLHDCSGGALHPSADNWTSLVGDGRLLEGTVALTNPGYARFSYGLLMPPTTTLVAEAQATTPVDTGTAAAIVALGFLDPGEATFPHDQNWFVDVLVRGGSPLDNAPMRAAVRTGEGGLLASVQVLPAFIPEGGYDQANVKVEVEYPTTGNGIGQTLLNIGRQPFSSPSATQDTADGRAAAFALSTPIPTAKQVFALNDDGVNGDLHAKNGQWSVQIPTLANVDGMYRFNFIADFTKGGCTTRREIVRSAFVDVGVDPTASGLSVTPRPAGQVQIDICPKDAFGNPAGWGRIPSCGPEGACTCGPADIVDRGDGCYTITVTVTSSSLVSSCTIDGLGSPVGVRVAPEVNAPPQSFTRCFPAPAEETLSVVVDRGTLVGRILSVNGTPLPSPVAVDGQTKRVILPIGVTVVEWTATDVSGISTTVQQTVEVKEASGRQCCAPHQQIIEGDDRANHIMPKEERAYCVVAHGGKDVVHTRGGSDHLLGGDDADHLKSDEGADVIIGGAGTDVIHGGVRSHLRASGGPDHDSMHAPRTDSSELFGGDGKDVLVGGHGEDFLAPGPGGGVAVAGPGNDTVVIYNLCEAVPGLLLDGGLGTDTLVTPVPLSDLRSRGVVVVGFENVVVDVGQGYLSECFGR